MASLDDRTSPRAAASVLLLVTVLALVFARQPVPQVVGLVPAWFAAVLVCDLGTAGLLIGLYRRGGGVRLAVLGAAYLWSAAITVLMALAAPGVVHADWALGGAASLSWLWVLRHVVPVALIAVALAPWPARWSSRTPAPRTVATALVAVVVVGPGVMAIVMATAPQLLPSLVDPKTLRFGGPLLVGVLCIVAGAVAVAAYGVTHRRDTSGPEVWALVASAAWLGDTVLMAWHDVPGSLAHLVARLLGVAAAFIVMGSVLRDLWREHSRVLAEAAGMQEEMVRLVEEQRVREHVAAVIGHDLRAPLVGLLGYQRLLVESADLTPEVEDRMHQRSLRLTERLISLTDDLAVATSSGRAGLTVEPRLLDLAVQLAECAAGFPGLDVRLACPRGAEVYADPLRLQQILSNLISNARRRGADPVEVEAETTPGGEEVTIKVSDGGESLPPTYLPRVVERYGPAGPASAGTGLGLSVAHELVRRHGGTVRYDMTAPAFIVTLPATARLTSVA